MGFKCEINYILMLRAEQGLDESVLSPGTMIDFKKSDHRIYPVDSPIELANGKWEVIGRVAIRSFTVGGGVTTGQAEVLSVYSPEVRKVASETVAEGERRNGRGAT